MVSRHSVYPNMIHLQSTCNTLAESRGDIHHSTGAYLNGLFVPQHFTFSLVIQDLIISEHPAEPCTALDVCTAMVGSFPQVMTEDGKYCMQFVAHHRVE